jgi:hypothetical protein
MKKTLIATLVAAGATVAFAAPASAVIVNDDERNQNGTVGLFLIADRTDSGDWAVDRICISHSEAQRVDGRLTALYVDGDRVWRRFGRDVFEGDSKRCFPSVSGLLIDGRSTLTATHSIVNGGTLSARIR